MQGKLTVRFAEHFRQRRSEWMLAIAMLCVGMAYLGIPGLFDSPYFSSMVARMPQRAWGLWVTSVGAIRIVMLYINGRWRVTPYFRGAGAVAGAFLWITLFVAAITSDALVQSVGLWLTFFIFDCFAAFDAGGDARLASATERSGAANASVG